ncbi:MAG: helix-turn-helix domain-containing protein [Scandinavium sp.]|uniref:helix-turn-helix domain-containing protein n=1 Tax=Scandinavium sp. TaxID=2830653 RepID=UPI003F33A28C
MDFAKLHSYYTSLKIDGHVPELMEKGEMSDYPPNHHFKPEPGFIYFVTEGSLAITVAGSELTIGNTIEYMPVGLMERYCPLVTFEYISMTPIGVIKVSYEDFDQIFIHATPERVNELATILVYMTIFSLDLHSERRQLTSYQTIKPMLFRYLYRSQTHQDEREGVAAFIMRRTTLSRTHVFRVLADLKEGGYITVERGKLVSINKTLPEDY